MSWLFLAVLLVVVLVLLAQQTVTEGFDDTVFVAIASYRDSQCMATVRDAVKKADKPGRLRFGVCQQNKEASEDCTPPELGPDRLRVISLDYTQAKGPTYARYLCATLYNGEDYFLQIDAHTRFIQGWDTKLIAMLARCPSTSSALTHYPQSYDPASQELPDELLTHVPVMCKSRWNGDGLPTFEAVMKPIEGAGLRQVPFMAGGMLFAPGRIFKEVPLDPGLDFLFQAEEFLLSARLYTHGWDLFTPSENVLLHHYERKGGTRFWNDLKDYRPAQLRTLQRVKQLLGLAAPDLSAVDPYGMGSTRALGEFWRFCRMDPAARTSTSEGHFCRD